MLKVVKKIGAGFRSLWAGVKSLWSGMKALPKRFSSWRRSSSGSSMGDTRHSGSGADEVVISSASSTSTRAASPPPSVFGPLLESYHSSKSTTYADAVYTYVRDNALEKNDYQAMLDLDM